MAIFDRPSFIDLIAGQFRISLNGIHGVQHWGRVRHHGLRIGTAIQADLLVIDLFALLHDSQREDELVDPNHGERGAAYATHLSHEHFQLNPVQLEQLQYAIRWHSFGKRSEDPTIQSCWDADRLDLGRVGSMPSSKYLSEEAAKHIKAAFRWSTTEDDQTEVALAYLKRSGLPVSRGRPSFGL